jgi:2-keto-3-deoxy-6-phosphogluconate aldolase
MVLQIFFPINNSTPRRDVKIIVGCQTKTCFQGVASDGVLTVKVVPHKLVGDVKTVDSVECQLVWLLCLDLTAISTLVLIAREHAVIVYRSMARGKIAV